MNRFSHILSSNYSAISQPSWNLCQKYALWLWWLNEYEDDDDCDDDGRHWSLISLKLNHKIEDGSPSWKHYVLYIILTFLEAILYISLVIALCYIIHSLLLGSYIIYSIGHCYMFILTFLEAILCDDGLLLGRRLVVWCSGGRGLWVTSCGSQKLFSCTSLSI